MNNIIAQGDRTSVRKVKDGESVKEGHLVKLDAGEILPLALQADSIYGVALLDGEGGDEVSVLEYPFFDKKVRLKAEGAIAKDDEVEPVAGGLVATGATRPLFRADEDVDADGGDGQLFAVSQHKID